MKRIIALISIVICVLSLIGCDQIKQKDNSSLNYKSLVPVANQSETISIVKSDTEGSYTISGTQLAQFLDETNWTAQKGITRKVQRDTELNSKVCIQINLEGIYLKMFDTDTALIYDEAIGKDKYYQMNDGDYEKVLNLITTD